MVTLVPIQHLKKLQKNSFIKPQEGTGIQVSYIIRYIASARINPRDTNNTKSLSLLFIMIPVRVRTYQMANAPPQLRRKEINSFTCPRSASKLASNPSAFDS